MICGEHSLFLRPHLQVAFYEIRPIIFSRSRSGRPENNHRSASIGRFVNRHLSVIFDEIGRCPWVGVGSGEDKDIGKHEIDS